MRTQEKILPEIVIQYRCKVWADTLGNLLNRVVPVSSRPVSSSATAASPDRYAPLSVGLAIAGANDALNAFDKSFNSGAEK